MNEIFNYDGKFARAIQKVADIIIASVLWIVGCIPLITVGTSTTALYYASIKSVLGEGSTVKNFFKSYKDNLKQSIVVEVVLLIVAYIMYLNWNIGFKMMENSTIFKVFFFVVLAWILFVVSYIFPILARFTLTTRHLFVNAFIMSIKNLPKTIFIILTNMLPIVCFVVRVDYVIKLLPLIIVVVPGLVGYLNAIMFNKIFEPYIPKDETVEE